MVDNPVLNDRYRLIEQIGSGGMAVLYKAQDLDLDRTVAVKVLRPSLVDDPEFIERFRREARSAANLSHPNIVTVHDVGQDGPRTHYIVMEYVPGQDLKKLLRTSGTFEMDTALAVMIEVCKGVGYAHRAGLVHCDIKPQNILITPDNSIKVVDFGIARALSGTQPQSKADIVWGSPQYFSPEQAMGDIPEPPSDVYSIGVVLFELLSGRLPFAGRDYQELALAHINQEPPLLSVINPALPDEITAIVRKTLSKEPSARYRTADQLGRILQSYRAQGLQGTSTFVVKESPAQANNAATMATHVPPRPVTPPPPRAGVPSPGSSRPPIQPRGGRITGEPRPDMTVPTLPPADLSRYTGKPAAQPSAPVQGAAYSPGYRPTSRVVHPDEEPSDDLIPGVDVYNIALGIFAAVAVLGLIPLWFAVYLTLTR